MFLYVQGNTDKHTIQREEKCALYYGGHMHSIGKGENGGQTTGATSTSAGCNVVIIRTPFLLLRPYYWLQHFSNSSLAFYLIITRQGKKKNICKTKQ